MSSGLVSTDCIGNSEHCPVLLIIRRDILQKVLIAHWQRNEYCQFRCKSSIMLCVGTMPMNDEVLMHVLYSVHVSVIIPGDLVNHKTYRSCWQEWSRFPISPVLVFPTFLCPTTNQKQKQTETEQVSV